MEQLKSRPTTTAEQIKSLFEATASTIGDEFFRSFVKNLASVLEVRQAFISELLEGGKRARTLAMWFDNGFADNMEYDIAGTPCETVIAGKINQISKDLLSVYPGDEELKEICAESYLGIPLVGKTGEVLGYVAVIDNKPMIEKARDFSAFEVLGARATVELERRRLDQELARTQAQLIQSERMAAIGQLTIGVTHEINTPVGVLQSNSDLAIRLVEKLQALLNGNGKPEQMKKADIRKVLTMLKDNSVTSSEASKRIADIVLNLKKFTRVDEAVFQETDIHEGIESALSLLYPSLNDGVTVVRNYSTVPMIHSHPSELNQAFMTLLKNAAEAIEDDGTLTISTGFDGKNIQIKISDTGRGIPANQLNSLFNPGFSTKGSRIGMNIGLWNAYSIIQNHGGSINVKSSVGDGTEFTISLPIHQ